ncbi:MAG: glycoside hydrolase family 71/99-like protein [Bacteroidia bacterium]|nr:glycoside hydrolase family 71/99-like protein [Bacteroidia bacterium]
MKKRFTISIFCLLALAICTPAQNKHFKTSEYPTYKGLVIAGYQGWFIQRDGKMYTDPTKIRIDMWPDMKEYKQSYPTGVKYADGTTATFFSATDKSTIDLHFKWMKQYGIDGVFMQRFFNYARPGTQQRKIYAKMLADALDAASKYDRAIAVEYDLSGLKATGEDCSMLIEDWKFLVDSLKVTNQKGKKTYLYHNGKPLVAIWGLGFPDRPYDIRNIGFDKLLDFLKNDPVYGGCSILIGVPTFWRELGRDCVKDTYLHDLIKMSDIVLPWMVGRTKLETYDAYRDNIAKDLEWCKENKIDYCPVIWPGFSWHNLKKTAESNATPRHGGTFYWNQIYHSINYGCEMLFIAMFDEVNEGTAIFKITDNPPVDNVAKFVGLEGKPSDHYLWLTGQAGKMLRKEIPLTPAIPERKK